MTNLETVGGQNNCYFNIAGRCTNPKVTKENYPAPEEARDWISKMNCTLTQDGAQKVCSGYKFE